MGKRLTITFDANDTGALADFWAEVLGYQRPAPPDGFDSWDAFADDRGIPETERDLFAALEDPDGAGPRLLFLKVPEGKSAKNRVHLDVHATWPRPEDPDEQRASVAAEVARLVELGAIEGAHVEEFGSIWTVCTDPEGNEFCVV